MKKLSLYVFLVLMFCNVGVAELISLTDIKIGDKVTDYFTHKQISEYYVDEYENTHTKKGVRVYGKDVKYSFIALVGDGIFKDDYDYFQIYYENETDKIVSIGAMNSMLNKNDCISERNKDVSIYKKKNRISSLLSKSQDTHTFPDGLVDEFIKFEGKEKSFSFRCYIYPDGIIHKRFQIFKHDFSNYVFEKYNN